MRKTTFAAFAAMTMLAAAPARGQSGAEKLQIFGYFQNTFRQEDNIDRDFARTTFNVQQLNVLIQRDINPCWTAFVNVEFLNSYSSSRQWGSLDLEEAWIRYRVNNRLNLRVGLQVPTFNHLNEIKNRTPLLPYIIRPLAYESSFGEFIDLAEYVPDQSYIQAYGFLPSQRMKFDYALYVGNSPNMSATFGDDQSGIDSSSTFLVGGRIGFRLGDLKAGVSATRDYWNGLKGLDVLLDVPRSSLEEVPRTRFGADLSFRWRMIEFQGEFIQVRYEDELEEIYLEKRFLYATLGAWLSDRLFIYGSWWRTRDDNTSVLSASGGEPTPDDYRFLRFDLGIDVPNGGVAYRVGDRITLKSQVAYADVDCREPDICLSERTFFTAFAVSVFF